MAVLIIIIVILVVIIGGAVLVYNSVVSAKNKVDEGWAQISVQLKRRHDLLRLRKYPLILRLHHPHRKRRAHFDERLAMFGIF